MRVVGLLVAGVALGAVATLASQWVVRSDSSTDTGLAPAVSNIKNSTPPGAQPKKSIIALGTLEPRSGPISIGSSLPGFQILRINVAEGQEVKPGDLLLELDSAVAAEELRIAEAHQREAKERQKTEIDLAERRVAAAKLALRQAMEAKEYELQAQGKQVEVTELKAKQAKADLERLQSLQRETDPLVSKQQIEHQQMLLDIALAEHAAAKVAQNRLQQSLDFQAENAKSELAAAEQALEIARRGTGLTALDRQIDLAKLKLAQTKITAPAAGIILSVLVHSGEVVGTQPLLQIADLTDMVCHAEIDVADVPLLRDQRRAIITCRAFHEKSLVGTIERIRNLVSVPKLRPTDPRQAVDRSVTTVVIGIKAAEAREHLGGAAQDAATALLGLQVEVEIPL